jgi:tRNA(fMet)-specific endonuclease VapC
VTEPRFLLDANICIYLIERLSKPLRRRVEQHYPGELVTSAVAFAEVARGIDWTSAADAELGHRFFALIPVLPFDEPAARVYAQLPFRRGSFDHLIAAHALALGLTVVTNNTRHFADVPGLIFEDWTR